MANTSLIAFRLEEAENVRLRQAAKERKQSISAIIREAINKELNHTN